MASTYSGLTGLRSRSSFTRPQRWVVPNVEGERPARRARRTQRPWLPVRSTDQLDANRGQADTDLRYSSQRFQPAPLARTKNTVTIRLGGSVDGEVARRRRPGDSHQAPTAVHRYNAFSSRRPGQVVLRARHLTLKVSGRLVQFVERSDGGCRSAPPTS
jgi:hypothetical protein